MKKGFIRRVFWGLMLVGVAGYTAVCGAATASVTKNSPATGSATTNGPATLLMDGRILAESKQRILAGDQELQPALKTLLQRAEQALQAGTFSVVNKTKVPPSGDKHDYMSFSRYWWPDPSQTDGLPYIRRDGETNPESQGSASDRPRTSKMTSTVETLALAYYFTGDARFAEHAAELIRVWFLNPETLMNPNLNFAQGVPGLYDGKKSGVLDGRLFCRVLDGVVLISDSEALSASEQDALRAWFSRYLDWLKKNDLARAESESENNHGTFFDVHSMCVALFVGDDNYAKRIADRAVNKRIRAQIEPDGAQPEELARTRSLFYSFFNLEAMFQLAHLAEHTGVDLWHADNSRIRAAVDYVAPYANPAKPWPYPEVTETDRIRMLQVLLYAAEMYDDESYGKRVKKLPGDVDAHLEQLVVPLMR